MGHPAGFVLGAADARPDAGEGRVVVDGAPGVGVGDALFDGLPDVDLVREVIPARPGGELVDQALGVIADVRGVSHTWNLQRPLGGRNLGPHGCVGESV